jgi:hypothetical protein
MAKREILVGATDQTIDVFIMDSTSTTGAGLSGLVFNSAGLACYYRKGATGSATQLTLATQTVGGAHSDGGFVEIQATNMKGVYRLDLSDTMVAAAGMLTIYLYGATNMAPVVAEIEVVAVDKYNATNFGLSLVPANVTQISDDSAAADNAEAFFDGNGYAGTNNVIPTVTNVSNNVNAAVVSIGNNAITAASIAADAFTAAKFAADVSAEIADAVWDEAIAGHLSAGSTGLALNSAGSAGDPWATALPGAYGAGTAGFIIGTNLDATVSSRASQTSVNTIDDFLDTEVAAILAAVDTEVAAIITTLGVAGAGLTAIPWNAAWDAEVQSEVADALVAYDPPTEAEMNARTLAAASYATAANQATIAAFLDTEIAAILAAVDTEIGDIKTKTDQLTFTSANKLDAKLTSDGLDLILIESSISAGAGLTNDTGTQLTSINARQLLSLVGSALAAVLAGAATTTITIKPAGKPSGNTRITATVDADGNRSAMTLKVPD